MYDVATRQRVDAENLAFYNEADSAVRLRPAERQTGKRLHWLQCVVATNRRWKFNPCICLFLWIGLNVAAAEETWLLLIQAVKLWLDTADQLTRSLNMHTVVFKCKQRWIDSSWHTFSNWFRRTLFQDDEHLQQNSRPSIGASSLCDKQQRTVLREPNH